MDWVRARHECSLAKTFDALKAEVKSDVEVRNELLQSESKLFDRFEFNDSGNSFTIRAVAGQPTAGRMVTFELSQRAIQVKNEHGKTAFVASLTLDSGGECRFKVDGTEYESWFVRKMALEDLFFWNS